LGEPSSATGQTLSPRKVTLLPLIAATYFMVAGGPYGLEDLVKSTGYLMAVIVVLVVPLVWSLPTALMVSELSAAVPEEGGYYAWVRRAMGPFWGFQEAWLSLAASIFDMAIYPTLFVTYLRHMLRLLDDRPLPCPGWIIGLAMMAVCVLVNIRGARAVGGSSLFMLVAMLGPFVVLVVAALALPPVQEGAVAAAVDTGATASVPMAYMVGVIAAMWNYMGWDNASTFAGEVDRPQRTYPLAMCGAVALVVVTYAIPILAAQQTGMAPEEWGEGSWVVVGQRVLGPALGIAIAAGGMVAMVGMFNALVLSYSRVPMVLARDGYLPAVFARLSTRTGAPWVSIVVCASCWALALGLPLRRLFALDIVLYGLSLILEFVALVVLRIREPALARPFRAPGGLIGAALLGVGPTLLIGAAIVEQAGKWEPERDQPVVQAPPAPPVAFVANPDGSQVSPPDSAANGNDPLDDPEGSLAPAKGLLLGAALAVLGPLIFWFSRSRGQPGVDSPRASP
jgi:amino acid transporter